MSQFVNFTQEEMNELIGSISVNSPLREKILWEFRECLVAGHARPVLQDWVMRIPMMQQTVLLTAIRGPDGLPKYGAVKMLMRWYRRCVLFSAMDGRVIADPVEKNGGSFTGPSVELIPTAAAHVQQHTENCPRFESGAMDWRPLMTKHVDEYLRTVDAIPHHFHLHLMHAIEILGYKHCDKVIRDWWHQVYLRFVNDMHLHPETEEELDKRLGDTRAGWLERADPATTT